MRRPPQPVLVVEIHLCAESGEYSVLIRKDMKKFYKGSKKSSIKEGPAWTLISGWHIKVWARLKQLVTEAPCGVLLQLTTQSETIFIQTSQDEKQSQCISKITKKLHAIDPLFTIELNRVKWAIIVGILIAKTGRDNLPFIFCTEATGPEIVLPKGMDPPGQPRWSWS